MLTSLGGHFEFSGMLRISNLLLFLASGFSTLLPWIQHHLVHSISSHLVAVLSTKMSTCSEPVVLCSLDTGRLDKETYELFDRVERHYNIRIEYTFPDAQETMDLVRAKGMFSFYEDGHQECCRVRKVGTVLPGCHCPRSLVVLPRTVHQTACPVVCWSFEVPYE